MKPVDVKELIEKYHTGVCMNCGETLELRQVCVCQPCRRKLQIRGGSDLERYILIYHLLKLVREAANG